MVRDPVGRSTLVIAHTMHNPAQGNNRRHDTRFTSDRPWYRGLHDRLRGPTMHGKNVVNPQVEDGLCHRRVLGLCREGGDNISEQADCISSLFLKGVPVNR